MYIIKYIFIYLHTNLNASKTLDANISGVFFVDFFFKCLYLLNSNMNLYNIF